MRDETPFGYRVTVVVTVETYEMDDQRTPKIVEVKAQSVDDDIGGILGHALHGLDGEWIGSPADSLLRVLQRYIDNADVQAGFEEEGSDPEWQRLWECMNDIESKRFERARARREARESRKPE